MSRSAALAAVVLAGGESRRFGRDKLAEPVGDVSLLDRALEGLADGTDIIVVGPARPLRRPARFVREDPPGGGPAAGMVTGLRAALATDAALVVVLPGDAPRAGHAARDLLRELEERPGVAAIMATDASGFGQPLQLALRRESAAQLVAAAGPDGARGGSARVLVNRLDPPAARWVLPAPGHWDIDTVDQLASWTGQDSPAVLNITAAVDHLEVAGRPVVVALDGPSGVGKSTLARALALHREATVLLGDLFYATDLAGLDLLARERMTDADVCQSVFDWRRLRGEALEPLSRRQPAHFRPYDWRANDGRLARAIDLAAADLVILEGVYSGRPELADLVDLAVYVGLDEQVRWQRLTARAADDPSWQQFWNRGESYYFAVVRTVDEFDLVVESAGPAAGPTDQSIARS
jgi:molybdopterin-guanine dinucleotide biosynthesis protein A/uridine kinase